MNAAIEKKNNAGSKTGQTESTCGKGMGCSLVDSSVEIDDDVDGGDEDFGRDEDDY